MTIFLLGKNTSITKTIKSMLKSVDNCVISNYSSIDIAIAELSTQRQYDLLIANLEDYSASSTFLIQELIRLFPSVPLLAIHSYANKNLIQPMLKAGATGYLQNGVPENKLYNAVEKVTSGKTTILTEYTY